MKTEAWHSRFGAPPAPIEISGVAFRGVARHQEPLTGNEEHGDPAFIFDSKAAAIESAIEYWRDKIEYAKSEILRYEKRIADLLVLYAPLVIAAEQAAGRCARYVGVDPAMHSVYCQRPIGHDDDCQAFPKGDRK